MSDLAPWPPTAAHHHGFLRTFIDWSHDFPVAIVDDGMTNGRPDRARLYDQRKDEWMAYYVPRQDDLKGHPCLAPWRCVWTAMAEVLQLAIDEDVDCSHIWTPT